MKSAKSFFIWAMVMVATIMLLCQVMNAMIVRDNAAIVLRAPACAAASQRVENDTCVVRGSVSRQLMTQDVEVTLMNKSVLLVKPEHLLGYVHATDDVHYEPIGKVGALAVGLLIIFASMWILLGSPLPRFGRQEQPLPHHGG